jgi:hypothetical protein
MQKAKQRSVNDVGVPATIDSTPGMVALLFVYNFLAYEKFEDIVDSS